MPPPNRSGARAGEPSVLQILQSQSLTMLVQQEVEHMIVNGELGAGAKLSENALAGRLGVSRGPVREALRALEQTGLVSVKKNRGVFVRDIPIDEAIEIFELRATMEELVGRRLALGMTAAQQEEIENLVHAMEDAVKAADAHGYHRLNLLFHDRLVEMAGNRKLASIYRKLVKEISLFRRLNLAEHDTLPASAHAHWEILEAIKSGNPDTAGGALFDHAMNSKTRTIHNDEQRRSAALSSPSA